MVNLAGEIEIKMKRFADSAFGIVNSYCRLKPLMGFKVFYVLQQAFENTLNSLVQQIKEVFSEVSEINKENICLLQADVAYGHQEIEIRAVDLRLGEAPLIDSGLVE